MNRSLSAVSLALLLPVAQGTQAAQSESRHTSNTHGRGPTATARLQGCTDPNLQGFAFFNERASSEGVKVVDVTVVMEGLTAGKHAVHVHEVGACEPCSAAGGHFDPGPASNPSPDGNHPFHTGDLINIDAGQDGDGAMYTATSRFTLSPGPISLFDADGSALIVHVGSDSYCPEGAVTGCAGGARAACGVIQPRR